MSARRRRLGLQRRAPGGDVLQRGLVRPIAHADPQADRRRLSAGHIFYARSGLQGWLLQGVSGLRPESVRRHGPLCVAPAQGRR